MAMRILHGNSLSVGLHCTCPVLPQSTTTNRAYTAFAKPTQFQKKIKESTSLRNKRPNRFWHSERNQKEWLEREFNIQTEEDYYSITVPDIVKKGGSGLLNKYGSSLIRALTILYPKYDWKPWLFSCVGNAHWSEKENVQHYMKWLENQLHITVADEWYEVGTQHLKHFKGSFIVAKGYSELVKILKNMYPLFPWQQEKFNAGLKTQRLLFRIVRSLFPCYSVEFNYTHPHIYFPSGRPMTNDIYVPDLKLAFEYHGKHHTQPNTLFKYTCTQQVNDEQKRHAMQQHGISLIEVHYQWNFEQSHIISLIQQTLPHYSPPPLYGRQTTSSTSLTSLTTKTQKKRSTLVD